MLKVCQSSSSSSTSLVCVWLPVFRFVPKTSRHCRSSSVAPPANINDCSAGQLARLPAGVLRLHLASRHLVTSGSKATMVKHLHDALNPSATDSNVTSQLQVAPPSSTLSGNNPPSTNQLTTASAACVPTGAPSATFVFDGSVFFYDVIYST